MFKAAVLALFVMVICAIAGASVGTLVLLSFFGGFPFAPVACSMLVVMWVIMTLMIRKGTRT